MKAYLHVGMPKTGTTTLQASLHERARKVHHQFVTGWTMDNQDFVRCARDEKFWNTTLTSDESFCFAGEQAAKAFLAKFRMSPFITVRHSASQWWSWWAQLVAHGETRPFAEWVQYILPLDPRHDVRARPVRSDFVAFAWGAPAIGSHGNIISAVKEYTGLSLPPAEWTWRTPSPGAVEHSRQSNLNDGWASVEERERFGRSQRATTNARHDPGAAKVRWTEAGKAWGDSLHARLMQAVADREVADDLPEPPARLLEENA